MGQKALVEVGGQVSLHRKIPPPESRHRDQSHNGPISQKDQPRRHRLAAHLEVHHQQGGEEIGNADALKYAQKAQVGEVEVQQTVGQQSQARITETVGGTACL